MPVDPAQLALDAIERRLLSLGAYEALWHLGRMNDAELALLVEMECSAGTPLPLEVAA